MTSNLPANRPVMCTEPAVDRQGGSYNNALAETIVKSCKADALPCPIEDMRSYQAGLAGIVGLV